MCLILFAYECHPAYKLILAANRDEYYNRPTEPVKWWTDAPFLLAGKDLKAGGTWMGITQKGRIAALTNYRGPGSNKDNAPSRGSLVSDYLLSDISPSKYIETLRPKSAEYNGFNLIVGDINTLYYYSNKKENSETSPLEPGIYGLSNAVLDTSWPKVVKGKQMFEQHVLNKAEVSTETIFSILSDTETPPDEELPDTGVGIEIERMLSPLFIKAPGYGTRSSTVLIIDQNNKVTLTEKSTVPSLESSYEFLILK
jgi:uncharacterized protein with NRDE domain